MKMALNRTLVFVLNIFLCLVSASLSQERHTKQQHQHQHHHQHHHNAQRHQLTPNNAKNINNKTIGGGGHAWLSHPDIENELEKRAQKNSGWTSWSDWSTCSRSCDGGIAQQLRRCHAPQGCRGEPVRYRICNMQPCPELQDFRAHQCTAFDEVPYDGGLFKWTPHYDYSEPCALTCRGRPAHLTAPEDSDAEGISGADEEPSVIVQLNNRVQDGTRCRSGSLDMCIQGKCQRVGCDLRIGSAKKVDVCGVCGGNGSTCSQPLYQWDTAPMSLCSVTCGGGYKMSRPECTNRLTGSEVEESLCNAITRPEPAVVQCNTHACPPKWITDEWSPCSKSCGGGMRERAVVCIEESNGLKNKIPDDACRGTKPPTLESCNVQDCPKWITREWSGCSVSCGTGVQVRKIDCILAATAAVTINGQSSSIYSSGENVDNDNGPGGSSASVGAIGIEKAGGDSISKSDADDQPITSSNSTPTNEQFSLDCDPKTKPIATQSCTTGIECSTVINNRDRDNDGSHEEDGNDENSNENDNDESYLENANGEDVVVDATDAVATNGGSSVDSTEETDENEGEYENESTERPAHYEDVKYQQPSHLTNSFLHHDELPPIAARFTDQNARDEYQMPHEATFMKDTHWSPCSVTCGEGIRTKQYHCKIFLELSQTLALLHNDSFCFGPKPAPQVERCILEPCSMAYGYEDSYPRDSIKVGVSEPGKTYVWKEQGYTSCSASCLGGVEELIINCVREDTGKVASPFLCSPETKPEARIRTCNDRPCPPRWNYSDYSPCSKSCGIGIREREVQCIHEVTRGGENTMVVPDSMCPQPPPSKRQYCNILDCPVRWEVSAWSKCSKPCGGGIKERKVECKQIMAQEHKVERRDELCPNVKPASQKPCNTKPCAPEDQHPAIAASNTTYIQHDPKKTKVTLKIGGAATVFLGTQIKIKCPVKRYNRTKIRWSKNSNFLGKAKNIKISKKGALRILDVTYRDSGIYACHAGLSVAELKLKVKPKQGDREPTEADYESLEEENNADGDRSIAYQTPEKDINGSRSNQLSKDQSHQKDLHNMRHADKNLAQNEEQLNDDSPLSAASSSGTRTFPMPHFQHLLASLQFLWPFQNFGHSKGRNFLIENSLKFGVDFEALENDEPVSGFNPYALTQENENVTVLGEGSRDNVKFEWMITPWSECSQSCGSDIGYRFRKANCMVRLHNATQNVENIMCKDAGLSEPETLEKCGDEECARWVVGEWTLCLQSRCQSRNKAVQDRNVQCMFPNNTESHSCEDNDRPITRQECYNERCKPVWRVEKWSECKAACGSQGIKYRSVKCVWYGSSRQAVNGCKNQPRPAVIKDCKGPPCVSNHVQCQDTSRYCANVQSMGLCKLHRYQQKCCKSCKVKINS